MRRRILTTVESAKRYQDMMDKQLESLKVENKDLHEKLWAPVGKLLSPEIKSVMISPDGLLNFVSFATLLTEDEQFLGQKYAVSYIASGRDLLLKIAELVIHHIMSTLSAA